jgi:adenylosuccinate lyase
MATENILMAAVAKGGDRQELHERIRRYSHAVTAELKDGAAATAGGLLERLQADLAFAGVDFAGLLRPEQFTGRAAEQVDEFIAAEVEPLRARLGGAAPEGGELRV